jgi:hypothetical protein
VDVPILGDFGGVIEFVLQHGQRRVGVQGMVALDAQVDTESISTVSSAATNLLARTPVLYLHGSPGPVIFIQRHHPPRRESQ